MRRFRASARRHAWSAPERRSPLAAAVRPAPALRRGGFGRSLGAAGVRRAEADFYFGAYSNVARGKRKKAARTHQAAGQLAAAEETREEQTARRRSWAQLIRRVSEVDPLICAKCGGEMRVVAVILDPPVIKKILDHLQERARAGRAPPPSPSAAVA
jgi:hypothetical protein